MLKRLKAGKEVMRKAEIKIAIIIVYYTLTGVIGLAAFTHNFNAVNIMDTSERLRNLFLCESTGAQDCTDVNLVDSITSIRNFFLVASIMVKLLSVVAVVFSLDPTALKMTLHKYKGVSSSC